MKIKNVPYGNTDSICRFLLQRKYLKGDISNMKIFLGLTILFDIFGILSFILGFVFFHSNIFLYILYLFPIAFIFSLLYVLSKQEGKYKGAICCMVIGTIVCYGFIPYYAFFV